MLQGTARRKQGSRMTCFFVISSGRATTVISAFPFAVRGANYFRFFHFAFRTSIFVGLQNKNNTFCFMTSQSSLHIESTGNNCKCILHKYNLSCTSTHPCTYAAISKTIVSTSSQLVDAHDRVCASIIDERTQIRDRQCCEILSAVRMRMKL